MRLTTTISDCLEEWTIDQFSALLMLHAAHADLDYSDNERLKILEYISVEELYLIEQYYHKSTDGQILQVILKHKSQFFHSHENQQDILEKLMLIYDADGDRSKLEQTQYAFLGRLITDSQS